MGSVASDAVTVLYTAVADTLPSPPQTTDRLLIFTDDRQLRECQNCELEYAVAPDAMANIIDQLYGVECNRAKLQVPKS